MNAKPEFVIEITCGVDGPVVHQSWPLVARNEREALELYLEGQADLAMIRYINQDADGHLFVWRGADRFARARRHAN